MKVEKSHLPIDEILSVDIAILSLFRDCLAKSGEGGLPWGWAQTDCRSRGRAPASVIRRANDADLLDMIEAQPEMKPRLPLEIAAPIIFTFAVTLWAVIIVVVALTT